LNNSQILLISNFRAKNKTKNAGPQTNKTKNANTLEQNKQNLQQHNKNQISTETQKSESEILNPEFACVLFMGFVSESIVVYEPRNRNQF
jgi:hypothetical protein